MLASVSKAAVAFLALVVTNLLAQLTVTGFAYPTTLSGWVTLVATTVVGTFGVWLKANVTSDPAVAASQSVVLKPAEAA